MSVTLTLLAIISYSCVRTVSESLNVSAKRAFDAWLATHKLGQTVKTGHGVYITKDEPGNGEAVKYGQYIMVEFRCSSLEDSTIISYTDEGMAKQLMEYKQSNYYGPEILHFVNKDVPAGILDMVIGSGPKDPSTPHFDPMRVGGYRECIIPGWLTSIEKYYETEDEYLNNVSGNNYYYKMKLVGLTDNIELWQQDSIKKYMVKTGKVVSDTTASGIWYYRDKAREKSRGVKVRDSVKFNADTTIYINYIGRLMNGNVFDTNIKDTAKRYGLYNASKTYEPAPIKWNNDSTALTMNESSIIKGFSFTLWQMHPYESGRGIFPARLGYGANGSRPGIPGYASLVFDIDIVDKP